MKVRKLIEELLDCNPESLVVVSDYDKLKDKWGQREADLVSEDEQSDGTVVVHIG